MLNHYFTIAWCEFQIFRKSQKHLHRNRSHERASAGFFTCCLANSRLEPEARAIQLRMDSNGFRL
jgi:hypothetical protein